MSNLWRYAERSGNVVYTFTVWRVTKLFIKHFTPLNRGHLSMDNPDWNIHAPIDKYFFSHFL